MLGIRLQGLCTSNFKLLSRGSNSMNKCPKKTKFSRFKIMTNWANCLLRWRLKIKRKLASRLLNLLDQGNWMGYFTSIILWIYKRISMQTTYTLRLQRRTLISVNLRRVTLVISKITYSNQPSRNTKTPKEIKSWKTTTYLYLIQNTYPSKMMV